MNVVISSDLSEIDRLHNEVSAFCRDQRLSSDVEGDLNLALEEVVVNVIRYGHPEGGKHEILVRLTLEDDSVVAAVEDDGVPFNPLHAPEPDIHGPIEDRRIGGLGIHLVRNLMDDIEYHRSERRNRLVMRKHVRI